jgi:hypothetical protein
MVVLAGVVDVAENKVDGKATNTQIIKIELILMVGSF